MNEAKFFLSLGMRPRPGKEGLAAPAVVFDRPRSVGSAYIETKEGVAAFVDSNRQISGRAFPHREPGNWF